MRCSSPISVTSSRHPSGHGGINAEASQGHHKPWHIQAATYFHLIARCPTLQHTGVQFEGRWAAGGEPPKQAWFKRERGGGGKVEVGPKGMCCSRTQVCYFKSQAPMLGRLPRTYQILWEDMFITARCQKEMKRRSTGESLSTCPSLRHGKDLLPLSPSCPLSLPSPFPTWPLSPAQTPTLNRSQPAMSSMTTAAAAISIVAKITTTMVLRSGAVLVHNSCP
jgi:hypothetical protein